MSRRNVSAPRKKSGGSMTSMRSGFKGLVGQGKSKGKKKKADAKDFYTLVAILFAIGVIFFIYSQY